MLFGVGDQRAARARSVRAHDRAAREAVGYLERSAAAVRRGHGGAMVEAASGLVAAAFRHRTSRAGDPQLHTHVLVANLGRGPDGRWSALDGRRLYAQARAASFVYQAVLRAELTRTLGVEWSPVRNGIAEVVGVPEAGAAGVQPAARGDRGGAGRARDVGPARRRGGGARDPAGRSASDARASTSWSAEWRARAAELGLEPDELERLLGARRADAVDEAATGMQCSAQLAAPQRADARGRRRSRARDVIQALCERCRLARASRRAAIEAAADRFLASGAGGRAGACSER